MSVFSSCGCSDGQISRRRCITGMFTVVAAGGLARRAHAATPAAIASPPKLEDWLSRQPRVARAIVWDAPLGPLPFPQWPQDSRAMLRAAFDAAWNDQLSFPDPPPNALQFADQQVVRTVVKAGDAWSIYLAQVATSLAVEIRRTTRWTLAAYPDDQLAVLFDGRATFRRDPKDPSLYGLLGACVPPSPATALTFLRSQDLLADDRSATIVRVLEWCRGLFHFTGGSDAKNMEDHWQYRGNVPASRVIAGTIYTGATADVRRRLPQHYTAGCHGTAWFLRVLLRSVNIPVQPIRIAGHETPFFMSEGKYMSHGDDPYNQFTRDQPSYPVGELLFDQAKFDGWFGPGVDDAAKLANVGRRVRELAIQYLPSHLLYVYALDLLANKPHEEGKVFEALRSNYSLADLDAARLWPRLDARVAEIGGAAKVKALYRTP